MYCMGLAMLVRGMPKRPLFAVMPQARPLPTRAIGRRVRCREELRKPLVEFRLSMLRKDIAIRLDITGQNGVPMLVHLGLRQ